MLYDNCEKRNRCDSKSIKTRQDVRTRRHNEQNFKDMYNFAHKTANVTVLNMRYSEILLASVQRDAHHNVKKNEKS